MRKLYFIINLCSILLFGSYLDQNQNQSFNLFQNGKKKDLSIKGIWQLDYYPDSILINRSINDYSVWCSDYAYNLKIVGDSCQFNGWNDRDWWNKLIKISPNRYKILGSQYRYWELELVSDQQLIFSEISYKRLGDKVEGWTYVKNKEVHYPFHRVNHILTQEALKKRLAKEIFTGNYKVVFNDTLECEKIISLDSLFGVKGINGISKYNFENEIDIDYPLNNIFSFYKQDEKTEVEYLSFQFTNDYLILKDYKIIQDDRGDFKSFKIGRPRMILKRLK